MATILEDVREWKKCSFNRKIWWSRIFC